MKILRRFLLPVAMICIVASTLGVLIRCVVTLWKEQEDQIRSLAEADSHLVETDRQRDIWLYAYTDKTNLFTERTYQCMTEMYSMAYKPVDSGPVCREACELYDEVQEMVDTAPSYIDNPQKYKLPTLTRGDLCWKPKRGKKR